MLNEGTPSAILRPCWKGPWVGFSSRGEHTLEAMKANGGVWSLYLHHGLPLLVRAARLCATRPPPPPVSREQ